MAEPLRPHPNEDPNFLVEGALYYERDTKFQEPNALNTLYSSKNP